MTKMTNLSVRRVENGYTVDMIGIGTSRKVFVAKTIDTVLNLVRRWDTTEVRSREDEPDPNLVDCSEIDG